MWCTGGVCSRSRLKGGVFRCHNFDEYSSTVRTACWYCGGCTYKGYSGVDRVQNAGTYQKDNVVASCKTCNFMKEPLSIGDILGKVKDIARVQHAVSTG